MASNAEYRVVNLAGLVRGITLVTFPAASTILTDRIAAFGVGPLVDHGTSLSTIYGWTAAAAAVLALLSFAIAGGQPSSKPASRPVAGLGPPAQSGRPS